MTPVLSILVPTLYSRSHFLVKLENNLRAQIEDPSKVEVLYVIDNGEATTGQKRNILLDKATGDYVCFIDDDDLYAPNAIPLFLDAIEKHRPDVVGFPLMMTTDGANGEISTHSLQYNHWWQERDPIQPSKNRYYRNPNHLNPVRRELALQVKFPDVVIGEDRDYSMRLLPLLKTEAFIDQICYFYLYRRK